MDYRMNPTQLIPAEPGWRAMCQTRGQPEMTMYPRPIVAWALVEELIQIQRNFDGDSRLMPASEDSIPFRYVKAVVFVAGDGAVLEDELSQEVVVDYLAPNEDETHP